jgi:hypothetical protein
MADPPGDCGWASFAARAELDEETPESIGSDMERFAPH